MRVVAAAEVAVAGVVPRWFPMSPWGARARARPRGSLRPRPDRSCRPRGCASLARSSSSHLQGVRARRATVHQRRHRLPRPVRVPPLPRHARRRHADVARSARRHPRRPHDRPEDKTTRRSPVHVAHPERVVAALTPARASSGAFLDARTPSGVGVGASPPRPRPRSPRRASPRRTRPPPTPTRRNIRTIRNNVTSIPRREEPRTRNDWILAWAPRPRTIGRSDTSTSNDDRGNTTRTRDVTRTGFRPDAAGGSQLDGILEEFGGSPPGPIVGASNAGRGRGNTPANANGARAYVASPLGTADADDDAKASGGKRRRVSDADVHVDDDLDAMARAVGAAAAAAAAVLAVDARADGYGSASASDRDGGARAASVANAAANPTPNPTRVDAPSSTWSTSTVESRPGRSPPRETTRLARFDPPR